MTMEDPINHTTSPPEPNPPPSPIPPSETTEDPEPSPRRVDEEEAQTIIERYQQIGSVRKVSLVLGRDRKTISDVLRRAGIDTQRCPAQNPALPEASKLDPFRDAVRDKKAKGLSVSRILREITEQGYTGGRTILADYVRRLPSAEPGRSKAKQRFETPPGQECQVDWSTYRVIIAGVVRIVHALACVLGYSRYLHLRFYRDQRQSTLLEGLARTFEALGGVPLRLVFDNMATVVLGRIGKNRRPLWHPRFLEFARHYGFEPFACRPRDPDRKGKGEAIFGHLERDLLRGSTFESWDDLIRRGQEWTDNIANRRVHGTTRRIPAEAFLAERDLLIRLPDSRFAVHEESVRQVGIDSTISIQGTLYTVPHQLAGHCTSVRLFAEHFEVLDRQGRVVFSRRYVADQDKGKLQIDPAHYLGLRRRRGDDGQGGAGGSIAAALVQRLPTLAPLVEGITLRMKSLAHIHHRILWRLLETHGEEHFLAAATRAQLYKRYSALAVKRILERIDPLPTAPPLSLDAARRARATLGEVDPGTLDQYGHLDTTVAPAEPEIASANPSPPLPDDGEHHHE
jgi:transposase